MGERKIICSFCGKSSDEVRKIVAGPNVFICNECNELITDIFEEEIVEQQVSAKAEALKALVEWRRTGNIRCGNTEEAERLILSLAKQIESGK